MCCLPTPTVALLTPMLACSPPVVAGRDQVSKISPVLIRPRGGDGGAA
jgi:hypothetical protein